MGRPARVEFPGALYHVMSRGVNGCPTFQDDLDVQRFLDQLGELVKCCGLAIYSFCLMMNHFHLLCETPSGKLSRWMQQLLSKYSWVFNRRHSRTGHLWQARYKAILVQDGDYFLQCSRYIHLNPIEAGLVAAPEDYRWSSYGAFSDPDLAPAWFSRDKILRCFTSADQYRRFVWEGMQEKLPNPMEAAEGGIAFGDECFVKQIRLLVRDPLRPDDADEPHELAAVNKCSTIDVIRAVEALFPDLSPCQRRRIQTYCLRRFTTQSGGIIASLMSLTPSAVSHAWRSISQRMKIDHALHQRLMLVQSKLAVQHHSS